VSKSTITFLVHRKSTPVGMSANAMPDLSTFVEKEPISLGRRQEASHQDGLMQPISSSIHPFASSADPQLTAGAFRSLDLTRLNASTDTHTDLTVVTAGGDRVTL